MLDENLMTFLNLVEALQNFVSVCNFLLPTVVSTTITRIWLRPRREIQMLIEVSTSPAR